MVSALLISLREGLEAALIVGIVLGYLGRTTDRKCNAYAWSGIALAVVLSAGIAVAMRLIGAELETPLEQIFEGTTMLFAVAVLTWMIFWMRYQSRFMKAELEHEIDSIVAGGQRWGVFVLAFLAVFREGIEMALFLAANAFATDANSTLFGALTGIAIAVAAGALIYMYSIRLNLGLFFNVSSILLVIFAAGLLANGIHEFQEIGWLPILAAPAWDTKSFLDGDSALGSILHSLIGYDDQPSLLQVTTYLAYWVVVLQAIRWWTQRLGARLTSKHA